MKFYRFKTTMASPITFKLGEDPWETAAVELEIFVSVKETPCGYWVVDEWMENWPVDSIKQAKRWISKTSIKRYCYPTIEEAWASYEIRRGKRLSYLERDLRIAKSAMRLTLNDVIKDIQL